MHDPGQDRDVLVLSFAARKKRVASAADERSG